MRTLASILLLLLTSYCIRATTTDSLYFELQQAQQDSTKAKICHQLIDEYYGANPDSMLHYSKLAFTFSKDLNLPEIHSKSYKDLVISYAFSFKLDSAKTLLLEAIEFYETTNQIDKISAAYQNMAVITENLQQPDSSLYYLDKSIEYLELFPDSRALSNIYTTKAMAYRTKGFYQLAVDDLLKAMRIIDQTDNEDSKANVLGMLSLTMDELGRTEDAFKYIEEAAVYLRNTNNLRQLAHAVGNQAVFLIDQGKVQESIPLLDEALDLSIKTAQPYLTLDIYFNKATSFYEDLNNPDSAMVYLDKILTLTTELEDNYMKGVVYRNKAFIALDNNNTREALGYIRLAEPYVNDFETVLDEVESKTEMADLFNRIGDHESENKYLKEATIIQDSLFSVKKDQQIEELNLIYQTEKKDSEIAYLAKTIELEQTKKRSLIMGLVLLALAAASFIYTLIQRSRKNKKIFEQEQEIEIARRKTVEQQLEFKQKELTARVLQLADKSEFLHKLQDEINALQSSTDHSIHKASSKISRMIEHDAIDNNEWEQFSKEFSSLHQNFLDRIFSKFGACSKAEVRLISLLKMNLSSKDIANILRISDDGIKKARYRLRKKLQLDSKTDLQGFLIGF